MIDVDIEIKSSLILNLELDLHVLDGYLKLIKEPPIGLYVDNRRKPFTYEDNDLILHPYNMPLDLNNIPDDLETNIVDRKGNLIISAYNLHYNKDSISNKPFLAILCIEFINTIFNHLQYTNNKYKELYFINEITGENEYLIDGIVKNFVFVEDIVAHYFKGLNNDMICYINDIVYNRIIPTFNEFMLVDTNCLYTLNMENSDIFIHRHDDIRTIRYMEARERLKFLTTLDKEYKENI